MAELGKPIRTVEVIPTELPPALAPEPEPERERTDEPTRETEPEKVTS